MVTPTSPYSPSVTNTSYTPRNCDSISPFVCQLLIEIRILSEKAGTDMYLLDNSSHAQQISTLVGRAMTFTVCVLTVAESGVTPVCWPPAGKALPVVRETRVTAPWGFVSGCSASAMLFARGHGSGYDTSLLWSGEPVEIISLRP